MNVNWISVMDSPFHRNESFVEEIPGEQPGSFPHCCLINRIKTKQQKSKRIYCQQPVKNFKQGSTIKLTELIFHLNFIAKQNRKRPSMKLLFFTLCSDLFSARRSRWIYFMKHNSVNVCLNWYETSGRTSIISLQLIATLG